MDKVRAILHDKGMVVRTAAPTDLVLSAVDEMCDLHVGALLVMRGEKPIGILSERDLLARVLLERRDPATTTVGEVMTKNVVCIGIDASANEAMRTMTERRVRHLPVVLDGKVCGLVSIGDLVRAASRDQALEIRLLHDYVNGQYPG